MDKPNNFEYLSIQKAGIGEFKDRGSKFIGYAYPARNEAEVTQHIEFLKKEHLKARHHCYAYILDRDEQLFRANDDGEPSGTAGKPILGQIKSAQLKEVLVVVVRYFGGTKLGTSGLINAYRSAAEQAIQDSVIHEIVLQNKYRLHIDYAEMGHTLNALKSLNVTITEKVFDQLALVDIEVKCTESEAILKTLKAKLLYKSIEEIDEETIVPFCKIESLITYA